MIDYIGKVLLPTEYDSLDYVTKDVVIVTKDSKYGAVDINNRLVLLSNMMILDLILRNGVLQVMSILDIFMCVKIRDIINMIEKHLLWK